jgi:hypothetical protein
LGIRSLERKNFMIISGSPTDPEIFNFDRTVLKSHVSVAYAVEGRGHYLLWRSFSTFIGAVPLLRTFSAAAVTSTVTFCTKIPADLSLLLGIKYEMLVVFCSGEKLYHGQKNMEA